MMDAVAIELLVDDDNHHMDFFSSSESSDDDNSRRDLPKSRKFFETITQMPDSEFEEHFRMSRKVVDQVVTAVLKHYNPQRNVFSVRKKVLITIWYLANNECYRCLSQRFGVAQSTAHVAVKIVTGALFADRGEHISWLDLDELMPIAKRMTKFGFPDAVGAIDGTMIQIHPPAEHHTNYYTRKSNYAVNLTVICDDQRSIRALVAGYSAKTHDARVFNETHLSTKVASLPAKHHILGDAAYPLSPKLLTPYTEKENMPRAESEFNKHHSSTRMVVERCFGLLKSKWHILNNLYCDLAAVNRLVVACCVLHNLEIKNRVCLGDDDHHDLNPITDNQMISENESGRQKRDRIARILQQK